MMNPLLRRISTLGLAMRDLVASAAGCFVFSRGFQLVTMDKEDAGAESVVHGERISPKLFAGIGAAIFLLVFISGEALAAVLALRR